MRQVTKLESVSRCLSYYLANEFGIERMPSEVKDALLLQTDQDEDIAILNGWAYVRRELSTKYMIQMLTLLNDSCEP